MIIIVLLAHGLIVLLPLVLLPVAVIHQEAVPVPVAVAILLVGVVHLALVGEVVAGADLPVEVADDKVE